MAHDSHDCSQQRSAITVNSSEAEVKLQNYSVQVRVLN